MAKELKKPTSYEEQISILEQRGCIIEDVQTCKSVLKAINYYHLTAYFLPFKCEDGKSIWLKNYIILHQRICQVGFGAVRI